MGRRGRTGHEPGRSHDFEKGSVMGDVLSIAAIAVLLALVALSLMKQRGGRAQAQTDEQARIADAGVQRERSLQRQADVRAAARADH
jgi:hypothetical protein